MPGEIMAGVRRPLVMGYFVTVRQQSPRARPSVEQASLKPAAYLHHLPRWLIPVLVAVVFVGGIAVRGWIARGPALRGHRVPGLAGRTVLACARRPGPRAAGADPGRPDRPGRLAGPALSR